MTSCNFHRALEPPDFRSITSAIERLNTIGAVEPGDTDDGVILTPLGFHLAMLPVDPRLGKMLVYGAIFRCLDPVLTIAASLSLNSIFVSPTGKRDEAQAPPGDKDAAG